MQGNVTSPRKEINSAWAKSMWFNCTTLALSPLSRSQCALMTHERSREAEANTKALEETQKDEPIQTKIGKKHWDKKGVQLETGFMLTFIFTCWGVMYVYIFDYAGHIPLDWNTWKNNMFRCVKRGNHSCFPKTHMFCPGKLSINVHQIYQMLQPLASAWVQLASVCPLQCGQ